MTWLANNLGVVITLLVLGVGVIGAWALNSYRIKSLEGANEGLVNEITAVQKELTEHRLNTSLHLDPNRDQAIWREFKEENMRRFDGIERKLDKLMLVAPTPPL